MMCPRCGTEIKEGEKFCKGCGNQIVSQNNPVNNMQQVYNNQENLNSSGNVYVNSDNSIMKDEELIKAYIGKNCEKIYPKLENPKKFNKNFSIFAFLFGPYYYIYRKMYLIGIALLAALIILYSILPSISSCTLSGIIYGVLFIPLYNWHINKKINTFKTTTNNYNELYNICKKKGGTLLNRTGIIVILLLIPILAFGVTVFIVSNPYKKYETETYQLKYSYIFWNKATEKQKIFSNELCNSSLLIYKRNNSVGTFCNFSYNLVDKGLDSLEQESTRQELESAALEELESTITITNQSSLEKLENGNYLMYIDYKDIDEDIYGRFYILIKEESKKFKVLMFNTVNYSEKINESINNSSYKMIESLEIK